MLRAAALAAVCSLGLLVLTGDAADDGPPPPRASGPTIETEAGTATPYGHGAAQVWVLRPADREIASVVVYLHGWGAVLPFEWHQAWLEHLLARGSAVVLPRYQPGSVNDPAVITPIDLRQGLERGFRALEAGDVPVVAAGFSFGAALAFAYAAQAAEWDVPAPAAVYAIFPVDPVTIHPTLDVTPPRATRVLLLAGEDDAVVGRSGADALWRELRALPASQKEYRIVRTTDDLLADHEAPTNVGSPAVRATFWAPLDELVSEAAR
jgi:acetyl esterase/lipase